MTACPYCATAITDEGPVVQCRGCGNPVAVGSASRRVILTALSKSDEPPLRKLKKSVMLFPKIHDLRKAK